MRNWFLIDQSGCRPVDHDHHASTRPSRSRLRREASPSGTTWPAFCQFVLKTNLASVREHLAREARIHGLSLVETEADRQNDTPAILIAHDPTGLVFVAEPPCDPEERLLGQNLAEGLFASMGCDGACFGYEPDSETLHLTIFDGGKPRFTWMDSLTPGPHMAVTYMPDGSCLGEDPRFFALRYLNLPDATERFDRYDFVMEHLRQLGVEHVATNLHGYPIVVYFGLLA